MSSLKLRFCEEGRKILFSSQYLSICVYMHSFCSVFCILSLFYFIYSSLSSFLFILLRLLHLIKDLCVGQTPSFHCMPVPYTVACQFNFRVTLRAFLMRYTHHMRPVSTSTEF
jgi:hypothetical protein